MMKFFDRKSYVLAIFPIIPEKENTSTAACYTNNINTDVFFFSIIQLSLMLLIQLHPYCNTYIPQVFLINEGFYSL